MKGGVGGRHRASVGVGALGCVLAKVRDVVGHEDRIPQPADGGADDGVCDVVGDEEADYEHDHAV